MGSWGCNWGAPGVNGKLEARILKIDIDITKGLLGISIIYD